MRHTVPDIVTIPGYVPAQSNQTWYLDLPSRVECNYPDSPFKAEVVQALLAYGVINKRVPLFVFDLKGYIPDSPRTLPPERWEAVIRSRLLSRASEDWDDQMEELVEIIVRAFLVRGFGWWEFEAFRARWSPEYKLEKEREKEMKREKEKEAQRRLREELGMEEPEDDGNDGLNLPVDDTRFNKPDPSRGPFLADSFIALIKDAVDALRNLYPRLIVKGDDDGDLDVPRLRSMLKEGEVRPRPYSIVEKILGKRAHEDEADDWEDEDEDDDVRSPKTIRLGEYTADLDGPAAPTSPRAQMTTPRIHTIDAEAISWEQVTRLRHYDEELQQLLLVREQAEDAAELGAHPLVALPVPVETFFIFGSHPEEVAFTAELTPLAHPLEDVNNASAASSTPLPDAINDLLFPGIGFRNYS